MGPQDESLLRSSSAKGATVQNHVTSSIAEGCLHVQPRTLQAEPCMLAASTPQRALSGERLRPRSSEGKTKTNTVKLKPELSCCFAMLS